MSEVLRYGSRPVKCNVSTCNDPATHKVAFEWMAKLCAFHAKVAEANGFVVKRMRLGHVERSVASPAPDGPMGCCEGSG